MSVKLKKILKNFPEITVKGSKELDITGLCADSRYVCPGNLFIAKKGESFDGVQFISEAILAGAVAILTDLYNPVLKQVTQLIVDNVSKAEAFLASEYYGSPDKQLLTVGITGTNGKTTTSYIAKHFLDNLKMPCGLIGTIECIIADKRHRSHLTTPDVLSNFKLLKEMQLNGCSAAVMEVSSHALNQQRVQNIHFNVGVYTNLSAEHLDYHQNMENYARAKQKLFNSLEKEAYAVVNKDDPLADYMTEQCSAQLLTYGLVSQAQLMAKELCFSLQGVEGILCFEGEKVPFQMPLLGKHNVYNLLAATGTALAAGFRLSEIANYAGSIPPIQGRLEQVSNPLGLKIFIDFAHKELALKNILETLRATKQGKLIVVFGCGGNRDRLKRPKMGRISEELADLSIITSDNPRNEPPEQIIQEILAGVKQPDRVMIQPDRYQAISMAIDIATSEDIILIAGRGHEEQQILGHTVIPFQDSAVTYQLCCKKAEKRLLSL